MQMKIKAQRKREEVKGTIKKKEKAGEKREEGKQRDKHAKRMSCKWTRNEGK